MFDAGVHLKRLLPLIQHVRFSPDQVHRPFLWSCLVPDIGHAISSSALVFWRNDRTPHRGRPGDADHSNLLFGGVSREPALCWRQPVYALISFSK